MNFALLSALLCLFVASSQAAHWAVLVAGSNTYGNYRHQSDIFHAYQLMIKNGIPASNIITMAYDDIANSKQNPFPGQVFNKPAKGAGVDVYKGVVIDYKGKDVTPTNFLHVLKGESEAVNGNKVLKSTADDNVFIYFADHGAAGLIAFPTTYLYAKDFVDALNHMHSSKTYKEMVVYIEACESGSMFDGLLAKDINIYATTAANSQESSYAAYCPPDDKVNGKEINSCLGDLYSVNFLENLDNADLTKETLLDQFQIILKETTMSHVQQFGQLSIDAEVIGHFEGNDNNSNVYKTITREDGSKLSVVSSRNVQLAYLQNQNARLQTAESAQELADEIASIQMFDNTFTQFKGMFNLDISAPLGDIDFDCLKTRVNTYEELCGKFSDYGLKYVRYLSLSCSQGVDAFDFESAALSLCL